jgi:hypothetical protein
MGWTAVIRFPPWAGDFSLLHKIKTGSEAQSASSPMDSEDSFLGGKAVSA